MSGKEVLKRSRQPGDAAPRDRAFVLRWVLLSGLGLGAGLGVGLGLAQPVEAMVGAMLVTPVLMSLAGSVFGAAQWLATWDSLRAGARWIAASALGLGLGMTLGVVLVEVAGRALTGEQVRLRGVDPIWRLLGLATMGVVAGLAVGAAQGLVLRRRAGLNRQWMLVCVIGFGVGFPAGSVAAEALGGLDAPLGVAGFLLVTGLVVGAFTARLARTPVLEASPSSTG